MDEEAKSKATAKKRNFLSRLVSFLVLWSIVVGALFAGNPWVANSCFIFFMVLLVAVGLLEFYDIVEKQGLACFRRWGIFGGILLIVGTFLYLSIGLGVGSRELPAKAADFESCFLVIWVLGLCLLQISNYNRMQGFTAVCNTLFGLMYVAWLLNFITKINYFPNIGDSGAYYLIYFLMVTKFSDMGAYVTGSLIGKHKMVPSISPGKTWEGFAGAIVISTGASLVFAHFAQSKLYGMTWYHAIILGVMLSIAAVIGDLIESVLKRRAKIKDSGHHLPGIGGVLDLLDSLLFNAPLMYLYLRHVLSAGI